MQYSHQAMVILGVTWAEASLAILLGMSRIYTSSRITHRVGWDLFWVLVAIVCALASQGCLTYSVQHGTGQHIKLLSPTDIVSALKLSWVGQVIAIMAIGFGKIAVIALLLQIQGPTHRKKAYFLHFIWISNMCINIMQIVLILRQCTPVEKIWDNNVPGSCAFRTTTSELGYFQGTWAAASDIALAIYPMFVFWDLNLNWQRKVGLCILMGGGVIAAAAAILKTIYIKLITNTTDPTYTTSPLLIWAYTEMWLIIILGSIPPLKSLMARMFRSVGELSSGSRSHVSKGNMMGSYQLESSNKSSAMSPHLHNGGKGSYAIRAMDRNNNARLNDNESEEDILPPTNLNQGIHRQTDIHVAYDEPVFGEEDANNHFHNQFRRDMA